MDSNDVDKSRLPWLKLANPVKAFYPLDPRPEDIDITNIAWALSMQCRFNGHLSHFYSVAQHSVIVSEIIEDWLDFPPELNQRMYQLMWHDANELIFRGLMHDAPEAYIGDIVTPIKRQIPRFYEIEAGIDKAICKKFGMAFELHEIVKDADMVALVTESRDLHPVAFLDDAFKDVKPWKRKIVPLGQRQAYDLFLARFNALQDRRYFSTAKKAQT